MWVAQTCCTQDHWRGDLPVFNHFLPVLPSRQALTCVAAEDEASSNLAAVPGGSLLELEQYHAAQRRKLLVLQLVATLCESVSDTVFTDIVQVGHGKAPERVADQAPGCQALRRQWLRNSWRKLEHPQEKQFIDSVASVSTRHHPVRCQQEGQSQLQREEGAAQQTSSCLCPWLCIKSQESSLCVHEDSDLPASRLYFDRPFKGVLAAYPWCWVFGMPWQPSRGAAVAGLPVG